MFKALRKSTLDQRKKYQEKKENSSANALLKLRTNVKSSAVVKKKQRVKSSSSSKLKLVARRSLTRNDDLEDCSVASGSLEWDDGADTGSPLKDEIEEVLCSLPAKRNRSISTSINRVVVEEISIRAVSDCVFDSEEDSDVDSGLINQDTSLFERNLKLRAQEVHRD